MDEKKIAKIARRFQRKMQKIVDDSKGMTKITMQIEDGPTIIIAEKKLRKEN